MRARMPPRIWTMVLVRVGSHGEAHAPLPFWQKQLSHYERMIAWPSLEFLLFLLPP